MAGIKERVERKLQALIGLPLVNATRISNMECFDFGNDRTGFSRKGSVINVHDFTLHVQCAWRLIGPEGVIVGSNDMYYPAGNPSNRPSNFNWDAPGANRCDERVDQFFHGNKTLLLVNGIEVDSTGGVIIRMQGGFCLEIFPDNSVDEEHWRFFEPATEKRHFVIKGKSVQE